MRDMSGVFAVHWKMRLFVVLALIAASEVFALRHYSPVHIMIEECTPNVRDLIGSRRVSTVEVAEEIGDVLSIVGLPITIPPEPDEDSLNTFYEAISEDLNIKATEDGFFSFSEALNEITEAKDTACAEEEISFDVSILVGDYARLRMNVSRNAGRMREVFGDMLCINERESGDGGVRMRRQGFCPAPEDCVCPVGGFDAVLCVCEFFRCLDPDDDLKPILGLPTDLESGLPCLGLVVDTTGSMSEEIEAAKQLIRNFLSSEEEEPGCYVLIPYNDLAPTGEIVFVPESIEEPTVASTFNGGVSVIELQNFLTVTNNMAASGGGDCPERGLEALQAMLAVRDNDGFEAMVPGSQIVLLTDAPSHTPPGLMESVITQASLQQVCITTFLSISGGCEQSQAQTMYGNIAVATGGAIIGSIDQSGFTGFESAQQFINCAEFYNLTPNPNQGRKKRMTESPETFATEQKCHTFTTSLLTDVKLTAHTTQRTVIVTPPIGEPVKVPVLFNVGAIFRSSNPTCGEWSVCVETGTLTLTLENTDRIDAIIRYKENGVSRLTSNPPFSGTEGIILIEARQARDIKAASIELLSTDGGEVLTSAKLSTCDENLIASLTFPSGIVEYRITGVDNCGQSFSALVPGLVTFKDRFSVEIAGEDPVIIEPGQFVSLKVTVRNFLKTQEEFNLESEQVDGFRQIFRPSDKLTLPPSGDGTVTLFGVATLAESGSTHTFTITVQGRRNSVSVSRTVTIQPKATAPPPVNVCGCENGGTCTVQVIRGRERRRCLCPAEWGGTTCTIPRTS